MDEQISKLPQMKLPVLLKGMPFLQRRAQSFWPVARQLSVKFWADLVVFIFFRSEILWENPRTKWFYNASSIFNRGKSTFSTCLLLNDVEELDLSLEKMQEKQF